MRIRMRANFFLSFLLNFFTHFTQSQGYSIGLGLGFHTNYRKWKHAEKILAPSETGTTEFNSLAPVQFD